MNIDDLLSSIDSEIARLQQARALLSGIDKQDAKPTKRKRPKLSAAARKRIGDAQRKRWAAVRKAAKNIPVKAAKKTVKRAPAKKVAKKAPAKKAAAKKVIAKKTPAAKAKKAAPEKTAPAATEAAAS
jgi:DNA-binding protein HU-beta